MLTMRFQQDHQHSNRFHLFKFKSDSNQDNSCSTQGCESMVLLMAHMA